MSGQCNAPCATVNERRRGMMNKFQGLIDCYDNAPFRERMRCQPATLREFPTLVERSQLLACYPVCCPAPGDPCPPCPVPCPPCPPMCMPCPPMCLPCPPPSYPCPPCPPSPPSAYEKCLARMAAEEEKRARAQDEIDKMPLITSSQVREIRPTSDQRRLRQNDTPGVTYVDAETYYNQKNNENGGSNANNNSNNNNNNYNNNNNTYYCCVPMCIPCPMYIYVPGGYDNTAEPCPDMKAIEYPNCNGNAN